jgi:hypothetical protein
MGPVGMAGDLDDLPGVELFEDFATLALEFKAQAADLLAELGVGIGETFEPGQLLFEGHEGLFKRESVLRGHEGSGCEERKNRE